MLVFAAMLLYPNEQQYLGRHSIGAGASMEIIPILRAAVVALIDAQDPTGIGVLSLAYSISDEAEFSGGLLLPFDLEAVKLAPLAAFLETRFYF